MIRCFWKFPDVKLEYQAMVGKALSLDRSSALNVISNADDIKSVNSGPAWWIKKFY